MFRRLRYLLLTTLVTSSFGADVSAQPTPEEILGELRSRRAQMQNLVVECRWREYQDGTLTGIEKAAIYKDDLARVRLQYDYGQEGHPLRGVDDLFNGEITVSAIDDPALNRLGEPHTDESIQADERYLMAFVHDGLFPPGTGPDSHRNPYTFLDESVMADIAHSIEAGSDVKISRRDGTPGVFELRYPSGQQGVNRMHNFVALNVNKGWVVETHEQYSPDGTKLMARKHCRYEADSRNNWLPRSGAWQYWGTKDVNAPPAMEWQFEVDRIVLNDPGFDESIFEVSIKPGTYVNDVRNDLTYWVGEEQAAGDDLVALAQEALAQKEEQQRRLQPPAANPDRRNLWILLGVNAVVAILLVAVWYRLRSRKQAAK